MTASGIRPRLVVLLMEVFHQATADASQGTASARVPRRFAPWMDLGVLRTRGPEDLVPFADLDDLLWGLDHTFSRVPGRFLRSLGRELARDRAGQSSPADIANLDVLAGLLVRATVGAVLTFEITPTPRGAEVELRLPERSGLAAAFAEVAAGWVSGVLEEREGAPTTPVTAELERAPGRCLLRLHWRLTSRPPQPGSSPPHAPVASRRSVTGIPSPAPRPGSGVHALVSRILDGDDPSDRDRRG